MATVAELVPVLRSQRTVVRALLAAAATTRTWRRREDLEVRALRALAVHQALEERLAGPPPAGSPSVRIPVDERLEAAIAGVERTPAGSPDVLRCIHDLEAAFANHHPPAVSELSAPGTRRLAAFVDEISLGSGGSASPAILGPPRASAYRRSLRRARSAVGAWLPSSGDIDRP